LRVWKGTHEIVVNARGNGLIGAVELVEQRRPQQKFHPSRKIAAAVVKAAIDEGLILRALPNDVVAICPPLIIRRSRSSCCSTGSIARWRPAAGAAAGA